MRRARIKTDGEGFYHVVSRIGGRRFLMDDDEKAILLSLVRAAAAFSGVELYTYAMMDNHFHLLLRVPRRERLSEGELRRRIRALYGESRATRLFAQWAKWEKAGDPQRAAAAKKQIRARMHDLSQFVKTFKEAYTQDYNRRHGNTGTIWEGRFKSILLEGSCEALLTVAGYIHLNPVRAKMAADPAKARFTGYGAACAGDGTARSGLAALVAHAWRRGTATWEEAETSCREVMDGALARESPEETELAVRTAPEAEREKDPPEESRPLYELLRHRRAGFLHGGILGRARFLQRMGNLLPPRKRRRREGVLDRCPVLHLTAARGVKEVS
jgi:REP element-mobilizing transposase RayT